MYDSGHINNIFKATIDNDLAKVRAIIKSGINFNKKMPIQRYLCGIDNSALETAICIECIDIIKILINSGANLNLKNQSLK